MLVEWRGKTYKISPQRNYISDLFSDYVEENVYHINEYNCVFPYFEEFLEYCCENSRNILDIFDLKKCEGTREYYTEYKNIKCCLTEVNKWIYVKHLFPKYKNNNVRFILDIKGKKYGICLKERHLENFEKSLLSNIFNHKLQNKYVIKIEKGDIILEGDEFMEYINEYDMKCLINVLENIYSCKYKNIKDILHTNELFPNMSREDFNLFLEKSPYIRKEKYKILKKFLGYFCIWEEIQNVEENISENIHHGNIYGDLEENNVERKNSSDKIKDIIEPEIITRNIDEALKNILGEFYDNFRHSILRLSGLISGSFVLSKCLGENWGETDIDVYINKYMFENIYYNCVYTNDKKKNSDKYEFLVYKYFLAGLNYRIESIDIQVITPSRCTNMWEDGYGLCEELDCLIKFKLNGIKIDLIITKCNPSFFIKNFDFDFNKIFFNFELVHSYSWKSIINRETRNKYKWGRYNMTSEEKYYQHIKRITKYIERNFVILI